MTLTRRILTDRIAREVQAPVTRQEIYEILDVAFQHIVEALERGENVEFRNFGVFEVQERKERVGRNPKKPEDEVLIPRRKVIKFKPGKKMRDALRGAAPEPLVRPGKPQGPVS